MFYMEFSIKIGSNSKGDKGAVVMLVGDVSHQRMRYYYLDTPSDLNG